MSVCLSANSCQSIHVLFLFCVFQGLYPDVHGITDNYMYDQSFGEIFTLAGKEAREGKWWNGEPVCYYVWGGAGALHINKQVLTRLKWAGFLKPGS